MQPRQECIRCGASLESAPDLTIGLCFDCYETKKAEAIENQSTTTTEEKSK